MSGYTELKNVLYLYRLQVNDKILIINSQRG